MLLKLNFSQFVVCCRCCNHAFSAINFYVSHSNLINHIKSFEEAAFSMSSACSFLKAWYVTLADYNRIRPGGEILHMQHLSSTVFGYVAQIVPPPQSFKVTELRVANKLLRVATSSFSANSIYSLDVYHGPRLNRPVVYLYSCLVRAAAKTLHGFTLQHKTLLDRALDSLPLALLQHGRARPVGWDS